MPDGRLTLAEPAGSEFKRRIHGGTPASGTRPSPLMHASRPDGRLPLSVMVIPLPGDMIGWTCALPRWLVLVFDPEGGIEPAIDLLTRDLGISVREAEVAALLAIGYRLTDVATRLGISVHTVRSQVKAIFSKTGLQSQSDLVRRVLSGPAMHGNPASRV
jgi:DNA-binding CsgD family transcriptional regulator